MRTATERKKCPVRDTVVLAATSPASKQFRQVIACKLFKVATVYVSPTVLFSIIKMEFARGVFNCKKSVLMCSAFNFARKWYVVIGITMQGDVLIK